jgi:hypothetical protein
MSNPATTWNDPAAPAGAFGEQSQPSVSRDDWTLINEPQNWRHDIAHMNKNTIAAMDETGFGFTIAELHGPGPAFTRTP